MLELLGWYDSNKRILPWRNTKDPYKIWLSEIILQQTRVEFGLKYYTKFIGEFPTVNELSKAREQSVLKLWQGLGYYSRARNMHLSAKIITEKLNGEFPDNFFDLKKLKGVGNYTAAAIASICFNEAVPAIDGNAFRVLSRVFDINKDISTAKNQKYFFELGKSIISPERPGDFNQAIMDLGSKICKPKNPECSSCPLEAKCLALKNNSIAERPVKNKKIKIKERFIHFLVFKNNRSVLMRKNTTERIWQNLYLFPYIESENLEDLYNQINVEFPNYNLKLVFNEVHKLTHQKLNIKFWEMNENKNMKMNFSEELNWILLSDLEDYPVPKPIETFLTRIMH